MSQVKVYFLGSEYDVPTELKEFVGYLQHFEGIYNKLIPLVTDQMQKKEYCGGGDDKSFDYYRVPLTDCGKQIIAELSERGIYDVTLNDIVYNNAGYRQISTVCTDTIKGLSRILQNAIQGWINGYEKSYAVADSTVKGSGVSVWTNSVSSTMLYTALESSVIKKQVNAADKQFRAELSALDENITNRQERETMNLLANTYYPGIVSGIGLFVSEMMELYVCKLEEHAIFEYSKVKAYDLKRSSDLLNNLSFVSEKSKLIKESFICCPYNPDVYAAAMVNELADLRTFETAKYFMQDGVLSSRIQKYIDEYCYKKEELRTPVKALAMYTGTDESEIWGKIYSQDKNAFLIYIKSMEDIITSRESLVSWISKNVSNDAVDLSSMGEGTLKEKVNFLIVSEVISNETFEHLKEHNIIPTRYCAFNTLEEMNKKHSDEIFDKLKAYVVELKSHIAEKMEIAELAHNKYKDALQAHTKKHEELQRTETELISKRKGLGLFSFSEKREIDAKIIECKQALDSIERSHIVKTLEEEYAQKNLEIHRLFI